MKCAKDELEQFAPSLFDRAKSSMRGMLNEMLNGLGSI